LKAKPFNIVLYNVSRHSEINVMFLFFATNNILINIEYKTVNCIIHVGRYGKINFMSLLLQPTAFYIIL